MTVTGSAVLRLLAFLCFALATFGTPVPVVALIPLGLAFWVASTFV